MRIKEGVDLKQEAKEDPKKPEKTEKKFEVVDNTTTIENIKKFLDDFISKLPSSNLKYEIKEEDNIVKVDIDGDDTGYLI